MVFIYAIIYEVNLLTLVNIYINLMKKYFSYLILVSFFVSTIFTFGISVPTASATATSITPMTISQFVELLITIGVIPANKVTAARAAIASLNSTTMATSTATSSLPYIQVLSPNGGESWAIDLDVPYSITWGSSSQIPVNIGLVYGSNKLCNLTSTPVTSKNTTNTFSILLKKAKCYNNVAGTSTPLVDGSYKVRISYVSATGTIIKDESNAVFKINPILVPSLKLTYPNGGENLVRNHDYDVKYVIKNVGQGYDGYIYLTLLDSSGNVVFNSSKIIRNGIYNLELPSGLTPGAYKVKIKTTTKDLVDVEDISDNFFWISATS